MTRPIKRSIDLVYGSEFRKPKVTAMTSECKNMISATPSPLSLPQFLSFGVAICSALDELHRNDEIHTEIRPQLIYWESENLKVELADVAERDNVSLFNDARLPYISPEQTGRMNRAVDYRTDLYSLGVVFYELLTGEPPFLSEDLLEMIHSHIALKPTPAHERNAEIPEQISAIVMRLLEKNAEDRYQSAFGLRHDLETCAEQLVKSGGIDRFRLGESDLTGIFRIPHKLYGREKEVDALLDTYQRVSMGPAELLMVAGHSGVGKTALVHEVHKPITAKRGYFIEGKFDQFRRNIPYLAWGQAFGGFISQILMERKFKLKNWKAQILEAVGPNGKLITDVIPHLDLVIGPQPDVPEVDGQENQNRFNYVFQSFVKVIARKEHPLVVFLDDLQWIDIASLNLLRSLLTAPDLDNVLVIGAYRDDELDAAHLLMMVMAELQESNINVERMTLKPLSETDVNALCCETLRCPQPGCLPLARLIHSKTDGNAFFTHRMLHSLYEEELVTFDLSSERWQWDLDALIELDIADNVIDLMIAKILNLPEATQDMLQLAACVGNQFDVSILTMLAKKPAEAVSAIIEVSLRGNILLPIAGHYKFAHDRIQQAFYSLINPDSQANLHRRIGFLLLENTPADELDNKIFDVVSHLNQALDSIDKDKDRLLISKLNLRAGQKAKATAAFSDAKKYIEIGLEMLGPSSWQKQYALTLALHNENGELAFLTGQFEQISTTAALIDANAKTILDQVRIYMVRIEAETMRQNFTRAIETGLEVLTDLGIDVAAQSDAEDCQPIVDRFVDLLAGRSEEHWREMPEMSDEAALAASCILASEVSPSFNADPPLFPIIIYQGAILTLEFGLNAWSPFYFAAIAILTVSGIDQETPASVAFEQIRLIKKLQSIARVMMEKPVTARSRTKTLTMLATALSWVEPIEKGIELSQATFRSGFEDGDLLYGPFAASHYAKQSFAAGMNLEAFQCQLSDYYNGLHRIGQEVIPQFLSIYLQTAQNFKETCPDPHRLVGTYFDEDEWLPVAIEKRNLTGRNILSINKLVLAYYFDVDARLAECVREAEELLPCDRGTFTTPQFYLYASLAMLRLVGTSSTNDHTETINLVDGHLKWMGIWSRSVPTTFQHKYDLIAAEMARVAGDLDGALSHYEQAISGARASDFLHEEALANELYGRFWIERDNVRLAGPLLDEAHSLYLKWGATAKAKHLVKRYPEWTAKEHVAMADDAAAPMERMADNLDLHTILKASQEMAGEIELKSLLAKMMGILIENAGAQKGFLLMEEEGRWMVAAGGDFESNEVLVQEPQDASVNEVISHGIVNYVMRTQEIVVLTDAANEGDFTNDPTIQHRQSKSVLCTPLINQGRISGIQYLENNLATGAFTLERVELLNVLSSQMALALDGARLYADLERSEEKFRGVFNSMTDVFTRSDMNGRCLIISPSIFNLLGYKPEEVLGRDLSDFYADPNQRTRIVNELQNTTEARNFELDVIRKDGKKITVSTNTKMYYNSKGEPLGLEGNIRDITERKQAEEKLNQLREQLLHTTRRDSMGELSSAIAHELNQPLTAILSNAQAAQCFLDSKNPPIEEVKEILEDIVKDDRRAGDNIRNLRSLFMKDESEFAEVNINKMVEDVLALTESKFVIGNIAVNKNFGREIPPVWGEKTQLQQVLTNLILNALDSFEDESNDSKKIDITTKCENQNEAIIAVKDSGCGIHGHDLKDVFSPFVTTKKEGMGMGLAISKTIVEAHAGRMWAENNTDRGAIFYVVLPTNNKETA